MKLRYFYRITKDGKPVPGTLAEMNEKPKTGLWREVPSNVCCAFAPSGIILNPVTIIWNAPRSPVLNGVVFYDVNGNVVATTDPAGPSTQTLHLPMGRYVIGVQKRSGYLINIIETESTNIIATGIFNYGGEVDTADFVNLISSYTILTP